jgi:hypothetical protein
MKQAVLVALILLGSVFGQDLPVYKINLDLPPRQRYSEPVIKMKSLMIKTLEFFEQYIN